MRPFGFGGEGGEEGVEVADQFAERLFVDVQGGGDLADRVDQLREVVGGDPAEGLLDDGRALQRGRGDAVGLVERLGGVQAAGVGFLFGVFLAARQ